MSKPTAEEMRISMLNAIRTSENAEVVDSAIHDGRTANDVAHEILLDRSAAMGKSIARNALSDAIAAAANDHPGRQPLQKQEASATPTEESLTDIVAAAANARNEQTNQSKRSNVHVH